MLHFRIVASVMPEITSQIKHDFLKPFFNLWLLQEHIPAFRNITARGTYTLVSYDIIDVINYQNLYAEYEWDFPFRNHIVVLYYTPLVNLCCFQCFERLVDIVAVYFFKYIF